MPVPAPLWAPANARKRIVVARKPKPRLAPSAMPLKRLSVKPPNRASARKRHVASRNPKPSGAPKKLPRVGLPARVRCLRLLPACAAARRPLRQCNLQAPARLRPVRPVRGRFCRGRKLPFRPFRKRHAPAK